MNVKDILIEAAKQVEEASVPEDLREIAFSKAVELIERSVSEAESRRVDERNKLSTPQPKLAAVGKIAEKLGLPADAVGEIYAEGVDGELELIIGVGRLETSAARATKQLALLVAGGRQLSEIEEWTDIGVIRTTCQQFGRFDAPNFSTTVKNMDDVFGFRGQRQQRHVKINRQGWEELKALICSVTGSH